MSDFIEWLGCTYFSFTEGATSPEEFVSTASGLGYKGVGVADRMGLYGLVRAWAESQKVRSDQNSSFLFFPGVRLHFDSADPLFIYPLNKKSYGDLCRYLSAWAIDGMSLGEKGLTPLSWKDFLKFLRQYSNLKTDFILISACGSFYPWVVDAQDSDFSRLRASEARAAEPSVARVPNKNPYSPFWLIELAKICGQGAESALSLAFPLTLSPGAEDLQAWLLRQSQVLRVPLLATTYPLYSKKIDQDLCDLVCAIRHRKKIKDLGFLRQANGERRLLNSYERDLLYEKFVAPKTLSTHGEFIVDPFLRSLQLAQRHNFSFSELRYSYPKESLPSGKNATDWLRELVLEGAANRYGGSLPQDVRMQIDRELSLVSQLKYEDYFLTIWDVLRYARQQNILFQGRGSAANSVICYCLGITAIDPVRMGLLFERFISLERKEPPDIDVDFEHERREEVMQEVYSRYGRRRAAMVATVICFRSRMAVRETAKALGIDVAVINEIASFMGREGISRLLDLKEFPGVKEKTWQRLLDLAPRLKGQPRHMGLHTGGFVLSQEFLDEMCILEPARKQDRSVIPWDKDDIDYLGWMKVDLLSLGMLTAIRKAFSYIGTHNRTQKILALDSVPAECPTVYKNLRRADTVGVFQIESRAQMNMLPRLAPEKFYDLVVEVAIVRPGPLQGGMVHPYLRRKQGLDQITYDHPSLEPILKKTLGVPIFQEQVMKMAVAIAGFTPGEADQLRKVMSGAWRSRSHMHNLRNKLFEGMKQHGLSAEFAEKVYKQIEGFGEYGFPESHAASFAILTYVSAWLKTHHPAEFLCALLNSQPMGFYSPRALCADAGRHGVCVLPVDVSMSTWDSQVESLAENKKGVRLGLRFIKGLALSESHLIREFQLKGYFSCEHDSFPSAKQLNEMGMSYKTIELLVRSKALRVDDVDLRRQQLWQLYGDKKNHDSLELKSRTLDVGSYNQWESLLRDHQQVGLSAFTDGTVKHPAAYAREVFFKNLCPWTKSEDVFRTESGVWVYVLGLLSCRQKPPTAGGLCFLTLEDELGFMNLVLMPEVYEQYRLLFDSSMLLGAFARVERSIQRDMRDPHTAAVSLKVQKLWNPFLGVRPFGAPAQRQALDKQTAQAEVAVQVPNFKRPWGLGAG